MGWCMGLLGGGNGQRITPPAPPDKHAGAGSPACTAPSGGRGGLGKACRGQGEIALAPRRPGRYGVQASLPVILGSGRRSPSPSPRHAMTHANPLIGRRCATWPLLLGALWVPVPDLTAQVPPLTPAPDLKRDPV